MVRNDAYWGARAPWERAIFRLITNDPARVAALRQTLARLQDRLADVVDARIEAWSAFADEHGPAD